MDRVLLTGFYRNFFFSYILKLVKAEMKEPGRLDLADGRTVYILESGYPKAVGELIAQVECNSDNEVTYQPGTKQVITYLRKKKNTCSTKVEIWIHGTINLGRIKHTQALGLAAQVKEECICTADLNNDKPCK
ncbi:hypothetical protein C8R44DRAFT_742056 [Mycena epipterygia]|nr:hypothetical protein C8R44DRAFT_742056 [Mycena epipterygia]